MSDPCECIFNHEAIMRRILSILQEAQTDCTDTECSTGPSDAGAGGSNMMLIAMAWGLFAMFMFMMRPASMRGSTGGNESDAAQEKASSNSSSNNNDNNGPPPGDVF